GMGRGRLLFALVVLLAVLATWVLTNVGTALIWTPAVIEMLLVLRFSARASVAFVFAIGFIADAASMVLPTSSPVNIIATDYFDIAGLRYLMVMVPVTFVAIASSFGVLWFYFDRYIPPTYELQRLPPPRSAIRDPLLCQWGFAIFGLLFVGYGFAQVLSVPVSAIALIAALCLLALAGRWFDAKTTPVISLGKVWHRVPWQAIGFSLGMYFVVVGLGNAGLTLLLKQGLEELSHWGLTLTATGTGVLALSLSGAMNNLPGVLLNALALQDAIITEPISQEAMVYATIIGCNMGAKLMPLGSLSTLLWLNALAGKGLPIRWSHYVRLSSILTLPVLFLSLLSLAVWLPWLIA
ncbi:arsenical efflux pump membrane protein ArsB, partial [Coleofasciculus sp. LEGE 07081]